MKDKLTSLSEAVATIPDGAAIAIASPQPLAAVREIVRQRKRDLKLLLAMGMPVDLLLGAGCVREVEALSFFTMAGGVSPVVRRAAESGSIIVKPHSEVTLIVGFWAGMMNLDFIPVSGFTNDIPKLHPEWRVIQSPISGKDVVLVTPIRPDVTLVHVPQADRYGNAFGKEVVENNAAASFTTPCMVRAADNVILCTEEIIDTEEFRKAPQRTWIKHYEVTSVVHAPQGSHPTGLPGWYSEDASHAAELAVAMRTAEAFDAYLDKYVLNTSEERYMELATR